MFATQFNYNSDYAQYELKVDHSNWDATVAWLKKFGCKFNATAFSKYALFELTSVAQSVVDVLNAKFNPEPEVNPAWTNFCSDIKAELRSILSTGRVEDLEAVSRKFPCLEEVCNNLTPDQEEAVGEYQDFLEFVVNVLADHAIYLHDAWSFVDMVQEVVGKSYDRFEADNAFQQFLDSLRPTTPFTGLTTVAEIKAEYRCLAKTMHPDVGGDAQEFAVLASQYQQALSYVAELLPL